MSAIETYLQQVFPNVVVRHQMLTLLSEIINGTRSKREIIIFQGSGANGKSTFLLLLRAILGDQCIYVPSEFFCRHSDASQDLPLICLKDKKLVISEETQLCSQMKTMIGDDEIACWPLYHIKPITFKPQFDLILTCNSYPLIRTNDAGLWRRVKVIPFESTFTDHPRSDHTYEFQCDHHIELNQLSQDLRTYLQTMDNPPDLYAIIIDKHGQVKRIPWNPIPDDLLRNLSMKQIHSGTGQGKGTPSCIYQGRVSGFDAWFVNDFNDVNDVNVDTNAYDDTYNQIGLETIQLCLIDDDSDIDDYWGTKHSVAITRVSGIDNTTATQIEAMVSALLLAEEGKQRARKIAKDLSPLNH